MNFFTLTARLFGLYRGWKGKSLAPATVVSRINKVLSYQECSVGVQKNKSVRGFKVEGSYSPELDSRGARSIKVKILFNARRKKFNFNARDIDDVQWFNIVADLVSVLGHEYVHLHQHRRRGWRRCKNYVCYDNDELSIIKKYLGKPDEVDAYAYTLATEMAVDLPDRGTQLEETTTYNLYKTVFGADDRTTQRLVKLSHKYFKRLEKQFNETIRTYL